jgi:isocitrate dehydrogenase
MTTPRTITLIPGDGIGPEVSTATRQIIEATGVKLQWDLCEAGAEVFKKGISSGVPQETLDSIQRNKVALKGPLETPIGYGEKSANVTLRKVFETYGNIRPVKELPHIPTPFQGMGIDFVVVRENIEDLYAGMEHMQSPDVAQALKLISRKGCEKIIRLAFELARAEGRKTVHCATKSNILKMTEGMMKRVFESIAPDYPDIQAEHIIVDNCAHQMVKEPLQFDVVVMTNMNGDILSDLGSALVGGLGFAPSANLGKDVAIFEAVHGSAPAFAGKNVINPTAMLLSGVMLLRHIQEFKAADAIENALFTTLEQKIFTRDVMGEAASVSTTDFTQAIIRNLGKISSSWKARAYKPLQQAASAPKLSAPKVTKQELIGLDVFLESKLEPAAIAKSIEALCASSPLHLKFVSNRGVVVYPMLGGMALPDLVDTFCCRLLRRDETQAISDKDLLELLAHVSKSHQWVHLEKLFLYDGQLSFTKAQGES